MPCQKRLVTLSLSTPSPTSSASWKLCLGNSKAVNCDSAMLTPMKSMVRWNKTLGFIVYSFPLKLDFAQVSTPKRIGSEDFEARGCSSMLHISVWSDITQASFRTRSHINIVTFMCEKGLIPNSQRKPYHFLALLWHLNTCTIYGAFYDHLRINDVYQVWPV